VFDRFPRLRLVLAEQGSGWISQTLDAMDQHYASIAGGGIGELRTLSGMRLERSPSEYWRTNCFVAASFMHPRDCARRDLIGADRIMWGADYPHLEGTYPFSVEAIRRTFAGIDPAETQRLLGGTAASVYGFDLSALDAIAARCGPLIDEVAAGLDIIPEGAHSLAFRERPPINV
jgi:predicted TIM-barrel fold metal-dependent hydrolase